MASPSKKSARARAGVQLCLVAACLSGLAAVAACRAPTEITIIVSTDVKCADVRATAITIGDLTTLDGKPATTVTPACDPSTGRIGSIVIVPSGGRDDTVAMKIVMGVGRDPAECVPPAYGAGCIVARRALHFIPSSSLTVPIFMGAVCSGIPCNATETCAGGNCVDATIEDSSKCEEPAGCGESVLVGGTSTADAGGGRDAAVAPDTGGRADAAPAFDAGRLPTDAGLPLLYVVSDRFWSVNPETGLWAGSTLLPTATCPRLEELAVDPFGGLFAIGNDASALYRVDPPTVSCAKLGAGNDAGTYPTAMTFAPRGTLDPNDEVLVGYLPNGDYVRIDKVTGALSTVTAGALAGFVVGDVVNVGQRGYVAMTGGACGAGDCVWEVALETGARIGAAPLGTIPSTRHVTALAHWAGKLYAYSEQDEAYRLDPAAPATPVLVNGPAGYIMVRYRGAGSTTIAPTQ